MSFNKAKWIVRCAAAGAVTISLLCTCSTTPLTADGGGTRGGNPVIVGTITAADGVKARNVRVSLIDENYNPLTDTLKQSVTSAATDSLGKFSITAPDSGLYNIEAVEKGNGTRLIRFKIKTIRDSICVLPEDTLRKPGSVKVALPKGSDLSNSYVYVPGTTIATRVTKTSDTLSIDSVPQGVLPVVYLGHTNSTEKTVIRHDVSVISNTVTVVNNTEWGYSRRIVLNTSSTGAGVKGDVYGFPVLIRLTENNFDFSQALNNGADIRFTTSLNTSLPFEIEQWDPVRRSAAIWVKVDTIYGYNSTQSIMMYWGNPTAKSVSNSVAVFDTSAGYQGVWHLGDAAGSTVLDATINGFTATSPDSAKPAAGEGVCGTCRVFDGVKSYLSIPNSADGKLNFPENGNYTISVWASVDIPDSLPHVVIAKGYDQYFLRCTGLSSATPLWAFSQLGTNNMWSACTTSAKDKQWTLITGVRQGTRQLLYCNGILVDSTADIFASANFSRSTTSDVSIGRYLKAVNVPDFNNGFCFFKGSIDEIRMLNTAQNQDWILLCYMNQSLIDRLVEFR